MKSTILIARAYGNADVLEFHTQELGALENGFARIEVKASGINPIDARRMTGEFKHANLPQTFGTEYSGVIVEINSSTDKFKVGDEVLGSGGSFTHATVIDVPVLNLIKKPENISWEVAGTLAGVSQTAMTILNEIGDLKTILIHGATGGVGSIAVQIAVERGIKVIGTASEKNQEYLKSLGVIPVVYGEGLVDRIKEIHPEKIDASVDMAGTDEATEVSLEVVKENGIIATIAGKPTSSDRVVPLWVKRNVKNLEYVVENVASGKFNWDIHKTFRFEDAQQAYSEILNGHTRGKIALVF